MHTASPHGRHRSLADAALDGALQQRGAARYERLVDLSIRYPAHGPVWLALAEEHLASRRREEARDCARHALSLDRALVKNFSSHLASTCTSMMPSAPAVEGSYERRAAQSMRHRIHNPGEADIELGQAKLMSGYRRLRRLEELSQRFESHAPTWLALAEEYMSQQQRDLAAASAGTALALDPEQAHFMSPRLAAAYRAVCSALPAPTSRPASRELQPAAGIDHYTDESFGDLPAIDLPNLGTSRPSDRTRFAPNPLNQKKPRRPLSRPVPAYLRDFDNEPTLAPSRSAGDPAIDRMLAHALEMSQPAQRLQALRELAELAPDHTSVLFNLAVHLVMADRYDEAREVGDLLQVLDMVLYRQLYDWAEEWVRANANKPNTRSAPADATVLYRPDSQRMSRAPDPVSRPMQPVPLAVPAPLSPVPLMHPALAPQPFKTQLLSVPVPPLRRTPRATPPSALTGGRAPGSYAPTTPAPTSRLRTAGALIAGVCAGLLVAMMLVFVISSASASKDADKPDHKAKPTLIEKSQRQSRDSAREPAQSVVRSATAHSGTTAR